MYNTLNLRAMANIKRIKEFIRRQRYIGESEFGDKIRKRYDKTAKQFYERFADKVFYKIKDYASNALYTVLVAVFLWVAISSMIQRFKCDTMTETQLFLHIPKSFMCDWKHCN